MSRKPRIKTEKGPAPKKTAKGLKRKCQHPYCQNWVYNRKYCSKHRHQMRKDADPLKYFYFALRSNAERRGIKFKISLPQYRELWDRYPEAKEEKLKMAKTDTRSTWEVDRVNGRKGYEPGNLQIIRKSLNIRREDDPRADNFGEFIISSRDIEEPDSDGVPF